MISHNFLNPLAQQRIVLVETSHPGNVGAAARAMKTMGLQFLHIVAPRFANVLQHPEALAFASGAQDILEQAQLHATLDSAIHDCQLTIALTSRSREFAPPVIFLEEAAKQAADFLQEQPVAQIAWVLGSERYGLSNVHVQQCQRCCTIPTDALYTSLNLAQAVQLVAYECHRQMIGRIYPQSATQTGTRPSQAELSQLLTHLEQAMIAVEFLNPQQPKKLIPRLQNLLARADLSLEEIQILRGFCSSILKKLKPG